MPKRNEGTEVSLGLEVPGNCMNNITCPNCGKWIEFRRDASNNTVHCSRCGNLILEDSQMVKIAGGEVKGPVISHLQDSSQEQQELVIHGGVAMESPKNGEAVRAFKVPEGTVEEKIDVEWKSGSEKVAMKSSQSPLKTHRRPSVLPQRQDNMLKTAKRMESSDMKKNIRTSHPRPVKRVYPRYYSLLFYGIPGLLLVLLILLTVWRVISSGNNLEHTWKNAKASYQQGENYYEKAQSLKNHNSKEYRQNLAKAGNSYKEAIKAGEYVWSSLIDLIVKEKALNKSDALKYAEKTYGGYLKTINEWRSKAKKVELLLNPSK